MRGFITDANMTRHTIDVEAYKVVDHDVKKLKPFSIYFNQNGTMKEVVAAPWNKKYPEYNN